MQRKLVEMEPNSARYHNSLGDTLYNLEQYEKAIELEPEEASYYSDISIIFRELVYWHIHL